MSNHDPWNVAAETAVEPAPRWWRTASEMSQQLGNRQWWNETALPAFGDHVNTSPDTWLGLAMLKQALAGGPAVHVANFEGNLTVPPNKLMETLTQVFTLRPVRFGYGHNGIDRILFSSDNSMLALSIEESGSYATLKLASTQEAFIERLAKLASGILTRDNPKEGFVYALARGMQGFHLTRLGAAGSPVERTNYNPQIIASYDHVVADLKAESPCGRLVIMAGEPGTGKTYLARALLTDVPKAAFVVVPPHLVRELGSPDLLPALTSAKHDGLSGPICLIIEDADKVLVAREEGDMAAISSLLNLGDGILGSVLDVRIIATTNASKLDMDPATRRAGRLCQYLNVGPLEPPQAETVLHRLTGKTARPGGNVPLAEVYRQARKLGWAPPPKQKPATPWAKSYVL